MAEQSHIIYDFLAPSRIVFGWGRRDEIGCLGKSLGRRAFLISGSRTLERSGVLAAAADSLKAEGVTAENVATISREPQVEDVDRLAAELRLREAGPGDFIIAVGGGSAIDLAKALAAMAVERESDTVKDYLENIGKNLTITQTPLAVMAVPTTAGTGAEATKNAVISSFDPPVKKSLRDRRLMPAVALVDPELTASVSPQITAEAGMDAITQLIESYISRKSQPIPRAMAAHGLLMAATAIVEAYEDGSSRPAREKMSHAALLSGMALANSGLGFAHGVAAALGVHCGVPHGRACALLLPVALKVNREVCRLELARLGRMCFNLREHQSDAAVVDAFIARIESLCDCLHLPRRLGEVGVRPEQIHAIAADSRGNSMSGNPRQLSDGELIGELENIL